MTRLDSAVAASVMANMNRTAASTRHRANAPVERVLKDPSLARYLIETSKSLLKPCSLRHRTDFW